jgi:hypothetical protein
VVAPTPTEVMSKPQDHRGNGEETEGKKQMIGDHLLGVDGLWGAENALHFFTAMNHRVVASHPDHMECAGEVLKMLANALFLSTDVVVDWTPLVFCHDAS